MYKLSDKESTHIYVNFAQPLLWLALSNKSGNEITEDLVKRAYAAVSCRNSLLRAVHKPEIEKFSLVIKDTDEIMQDEVDGKLPAHITKEFHTREEAWAEYERRIKNMFWKCDYMWEVVVCVLDKEPASSNTNYVVFGHFNHAVTDGAAVMAAISEFVRVLSAGLETNSLPPHNFLGESHPITKPFLERYPAFKFDDPACDEEKEDLFTKANAKLSTEQTKLHYVIIDKSFTEEATKSFIAKCKRYGVSVTAGFFAATAMAASAKKFDAVMPLSYRTKDNWGEIAVSFTDSTFSLDLASTLADCEGKDEDTTWAALAKVFHKEIRRKVETPEEKYSGTALYYVRSVLNNIEPTSNTLCTGPNNDTFTINISNIGILDKYFVDEGPLTVADVTGFCSNIITTINVFWCYTFRGKFRACLLNTVYTPREGVFDEFASKIFKFVEKS